MQILAISQEIKTGRLYGFINQFSSNGYGGYSDDYKFIGLVYDSDTRIVYVGKIGRDYEGFSCPEITANYFNKDGKLCQFVNNQIVPIT